MSPRGPVALLDANVLYAAPVRDLLLRLTQADLLEPHWSSEIHNEWTANLLRNRPDLNPANIARTRALMDLSFPSAIVEGYEHHLPSIHLPDAGDAHVLAAAIECGADVIVTCNLSDFPFAELLLFGIMPMHPDDFVIRLMECHPDAVTAVVRRHRAGLRKPPLSPEEYTGALARCGLHQTACRLQDLQI